MTRLTNIFLTLILSIYVLSDTGIFIDNLSLHLLFTPLITYGVPLKKLLSKVIEKKLVSIYGLTLKQMTLM